MPPKRYRFSNLKLFFFFLSVKRYNATQKSKSLNATSLPPSRHSQTLCLKPLFLPSFYRSQLSLPSYLISSCLVSLWPLIRSVSFTLFHSISLAFRSEWTLTPPSSLPPPLSVPPPPRVVALIFLAGVTPLPSLISKTGSLITEPI